MYGSRTNRSSPWSGENRDPAISSTPCRSASPTSAAPTGAGTSLYDIAVAAAFIQQQDYYGQADWSLGVLADEEKYPIETYVAPRQVESAVNVVWKGRTLMTPIGGRVNIQPRAALDPQRLLPDDERSASGAREQVMLDGLAKGQWWWD